MKNLKRWLSLLLICAVALGGLSALAEGEAAEALSLQPGDELCGFKVAEVYDSAMLNSTLYTMDHAVSGAKLIYVKNDDPEVAFCIGYRTPYIDETDTNHVFEHAILAGSEKYPAKDVFFDMDNQAYSTYVNANTSDMYTCYPLASMSQDQLLKMADVYMSCMVAPAVLKDERIFQREAIRFELDDPEGEIAALGTVFTEDTGYLTDSGEGTQRNVVNALYPGEVTANMIGQAEYHYHDLTYEHTLATYDRCYHFDNSLIVLYGDLNLQRFLQFLDGEYLSKYPARGTDLSAWQDGPTRPGFVRVQKPIPAYEGDVVEHNSTIAYAIDLDGCSTAELCQYNLLCSVLNRVGSPLYNARMDRGIENDVSVSIAWNRPKPYLAFSMAYADPGQEDELKAVAEEALSKVAAEGVDPEVLRLVEKSGERAAKLLRNSTGIGPELARTFLLSWIRDGDPNYYRSYEQSLRAVRADGQQQIMRRMALKLLMPRRSALVTSVPTPGLAEQHDAELKQYLQDMKAAMTPEEVQAMIQATRDFRAWNAEEQHNRDFLIDPKDLPDPGRPSFTKKTLDGATVYQADSPIPGVGSFSVYFDLSGMSREEIEYLMLANGYLLQMNTLEHTAAELNLMWPDYFAGFGSGLIYPNAATGENHRPMFQVSWDCLTEDFDHCLALLLEVFTRTDFSDGELLRYFTSVDVDGWDLSRGSGGTISDQAAHANAGLLSDTRRFDMDVNGQDCYLLMSDALTKMNEDIAYAETLADQFENAREKAFNRENLILMSVAPQAENDALVGRALDALNALPEKPEARAEYVLPEVPVKLGICIEDSLTNSAMVGDYMKDADFDGRYLPFVSALNDRYVLPTFRFQMGVYTPYTMFQWGQGVLLTGLRSDPNGADVSREALNTLPDALANLSLTQEELDGYILKAYSDATSPMGVLGEITTHITYDILGMDAERVYAIRSDIRKATVDLLPEAAEHIGAVIRDSALCTAGNEALIRSGEEGFDQVISWRHG